MDTTVILKITEGIILDTTAILTIIKGIILSYDFFFSSYHVFCENILNAFEITEQI